MTEEFRIGAADSSMEDAESESSLDVETQKRTTTRSAVAYVGFSFFIMFSG